MLQNKLLFITCVLFILGLCPFTLNAQGVAINADGSSANGSAMLDVKSTTSGMLIPRMTLIQRNLITTPATGLIIFQTSNTPGYYYNSGTPASPVWERLATGNDLGFVDGSGTSTRVAFWTGTSTLGSNANLYWDNSNGRLGIGTDAPNTNLQIDGGTLSSDQLLSVRVGTTGYTEKYTRFLVMGNGGTSIGADSIPPSDGLYVNGKVGIGTASPTYKLHVTANSDHTAIYGEANRLGNEAELFGVKGCIGGGAQFGCGVYGEAPAGSDNYGVYASGNLTCTGTKAATVKTEDGPKELYCQESPENWFEDFGSGVISNGKSVVNIKSDYLMTVTINSQHAIKVFITPNGPMGNWWVEKKDDSFIVHAPDAQNDTEFDFRVVAKRKGYEDLRLKDVPGAYTDKFLYPSVNDVPEKYKEEWLKANANKEDK